jgi:USP6 N-terminal-like protein
VNQGIKIRVLLQVRLELDFGYDDDTVITNLRECMEELRKGKLDGSGSPPSHELPQKPFGLFTPPPLAQQVTNMQIFAH